MYQLSEIQFLHYSPPKSQTYLKQLRFSIKLFKYRQINRKILTGFIIQSSKARNLTDKICFGIGEYPPYIFATTTLMVVGQKNILLSPNFADRSS